MKEFPRWYLILAFLSLCPLLVVHVFLTRWFSLESGLLNVLAYLAVNLLWIGPLTMFFVALNEYRRGYPKRAYIMTIATIVLTVLGSVWLFID